MVPTAQVTGTEGVDTGTGADGGVGVDSRPGTSVVPPPAMLTTGNTGDGRDGGVGRLPRRRPQSGATRRTSACGRPVGGGGGRSASEGGEESWPATRGDDVGGGGGDGVTFEVADGVGDDGDGDDGCDRGGAPSINRPLRPTKVDPRVVSGGRSSGDVPPPPPSPRTAAAASSAAHASSDSDADAEGSESDESQAERLSLPRARRREGEGGDGAPRRHAANTLGVDGIVGRERGRAKERSRGWGGSQGEHLRFSGWKGEGDQE